jgi:hypothetical protein
MLDNEFSPTYAHCIQILNTKLYKCVILISFSLAAEAVSAQGVYNSNVVGYVVTTFNAGINLFENPLEDPPDNLSNLFYQFPVPNGTTISLWNSTQSSFDTTSEYLNGSWTVDLMLQPGTGAQLNTPLAFTNVFIGSVLNHDGSSWSENPILPPVFSGPNGIYLLGDKSPTVDTGTSIFLNILGRLPNVGEQVTTLSGTSTYLGNGDWDNVPTLGVGDAAFFNIESVPEPSAFSLFSLCVLFICWWLKWPNMRIGCKAASQIKPSCF